jgi:hypothetical protein
MKTFHNKQNLKEYTTTKPALQKIMKVLLYTEKETRVSRKMQKRITLLIKQTSKQGIAKM